MKTFLSVLFSLIFGFSYSKAQVPVLSSYPSARATVYLDFDGQYVTGTSWNWYGDINAQPAFLSTNAITEIFNRVAEDFRIFDLNITTDSTVFLSAPQAQRVRIIVTPTSSWYGVAGGVSFIESFTWGDDTPAWVFSQLLGNNIKFIAEACSHEAGHTLGLQHQSSYDAYCTKIAEYGPGQGSGEIGWAPIMGVGYYKNLTTWHNGKSSVGCNYLQDDITRIASINGFSFRMDDHANDKEQATDIILDGSTFKASGIINSSADRDAFKIVLPTNQNLRVIAFPENVGNSNSGADLDLRVSIVNDRSDTIGRYNPSDLLNAGVDTALEAGTYYLIAQGVGNTNISNYGSLGRYLLTGSLNMSLPVHHVLLKGKVSTGFHLLNWTFTTDELIKEFEVQFSHTGSSFEKLLTVGSSESGASYQPQVYNKIYYRVKAITLAEEIGYYSNVISLPPAPVKKVITLFNPTTGDEIKLNSLADCNYELIMSNGQVVATGTIHVGMNKIMTPVNVKGLFLLRIIHANEVWTEKIIKQ